MELDIDEFRKYLDLKRSEATGKSRAGRRRSVHSCPLARYSDKLVYERYIVDSEDFHREKLPLWAVRFVQIVDAIRRRKCITYDEALEALDQVVEGIGEWQENRNAAIPLKF